MRLIFFFLSFTAIAQTEIDEIARRLTMEIMEPQLYGGRPAKADELPTAAFMGFCSSHFFGNDRAKNKSWLFTAAHCVSTGQRISVKSRKGDSYTGVCTQHPDYSERTVAWDFAICEMTPALPEGSLLAEIDPSPVKVGDGVILNGFGRPNIGVLHLGSSVVFQISAQDIVTNSPTAYGSGDSGSSLLRGPTDLVNGPFKIVGITSRREVGGNRSYSNRVELANSMKFFKDYAEKRGASLCGVNAECAKPSDQIPEKCLGEVEIVEYFKRETQTAEKALAACLK